MALNTQEVRQQLQLKWAINPKRMWIPLVGRMKDDIIYFNFKEFDEAFGLLKLQNLVARLVTEPIFVISEVGEDKEANYNSIKTFEDSGQVEIYYCDQQATWVIYISHEDTIAIGGKVLIQGLKEQWVDLKFYANPWSGIR